MTVNTKQATRRALRLDSMEALRADLDKVRAAQEAGTIGHTGNWTPGQILMHCSYLFGVALDGSEMKVPWMLRKVVQVFFKKKALSGEPAKPGIKLPKNASELMPPEGTTFEEGYAALSGMVDRVLGGEKMLKPSPLFGELTHEEWVVLQLGHCSMHMSFIRLEK